MKCLPTGWLRTQIDVGDNTLFFSYFMKVLD